jgi:spoIIIJ-associated protein
VRPERGDRGDRGERRERRPVERVQATEQTAQEAKAWLDGLFAKMQLSVQAKAQPSEDGLSVDLSGPDARRVLDGLGQGHGYLLSALQTLVPLVVFRDGRGNVTVDAHGHRQRRVEGLGRLATYLGDKAVSSGRSITLLGMASFERKAIHAGLGEHPTARTESEGEGPLRRLKIR